jgi:hypothetical protein
MQDQVDHPLTISTTLLIFPSNYDAEEKERPFRSKQKHRGKDSLDSFKRGKMTIASGCSILVTFSQLKCQGAIAQPQ